MASRKDFSWLSKEFAYSAQRHLHACTGNTFGRAHIYELLAASFGFNSYAAFISDAVFTQCRLDTKRLFQHNSAVRQRCIKLGYQPATADAVSSELPALVTEHQIAVIRFSELVADLRGALSFTDEYTEWDEGHELDDDSEEMPTYSWAGPRGKEFSPILLDGLKV